MPYALKSNPETVGDIAFTGHYNESLYDESDTDRFDSNVIARLMQRKQNNGGLPLQRGDLLIETAKEIGKNLTEKISHPALVRSFQLGYPYGGTLAPQLASNLDTS